MQVVACGNCGAKNRVEESRLATSEAKCGKCGEKLAVAGGGEDSKPIVITDQTFEREVFQARGRPILVDCWAPWCGPCRMIAPIIDALAKEFAGKATIGKLNVDENQRTATRFGVQSIPTLLVLKNGREVDRIIGAQPKEAIAGKLQQHL